MKAYTTTANNTYRLTGIQWFIAVVGIITAITCAVVLMSETLQERIQPTSVLHAEWRMPVLEKVQVLILDSGFESVIGNR